MKVGKDSVVMGNVPTGTEVGDGSVVVGATDSRGNTILNTPMAVGRNASAGPNSIAIGAGANAGGTPNPAALIHELLLLAEKARDKSTANNLKQISTELTKPQPDRSLIQKAWEGVKAAGSLNGAHTLLVKLSALLGIA